MTHGLTITMDALKIGEEAIIMGFKSSLDPDKYLEMGVVPGEKCKLIQRAPFNGPYCIQLGNADSLIALRKKEASTIKVVLVNG